MDYVKIQERVSTNGTMVYRVTTGLHKWFWTGDKKKAFAIASEYSSTAKPLSFYHARKLGVVV